MVFVASLISQQEPDILFKACLINFFISCFSNMLMVSVHRTRLNNCTSTDLERSTVSCINGLQTVDALFPFMSAGF